MKSESPEALLKEGTEDFLTTTQDNRKGSVKANAGCATTCDVCVLSLFVNVLWCDMCMYLLRSSLCLSEMDEK